jgi:hypothetical protein
VSEPEDPKLRASRWRHERREVAEQRERIVLIPGRAEGSHGAAVRHIHELVAVSDVTQRKSGAKPLSAKALRTQADEGKLDGMAWGTFDNHVSAIRNSRGIPFSVLLANERNNEIEMGSARADPIVIKALWNEHRREQKLLTLAERNASKFRTGRRKGAKGKKPNHGLR